MKETAANAPFSSCVAVCDLCGLPVRTGAFTAVFGDRRYRYCCAGCRMVFAMLMEAADAPDPSHFRQTDLYRRCLSAGVIPAPAEALTDGARPGPEAADVAGAPDSFVDRNSHSLCVDYLVRGMWCPACAWVIGAAVGRLDGIHETRCDFSTDRLRCRYDPTRLSPEQIRQTVSRLGYPVAAPDQDQASGLRGEFIRLGISALLSLNVMMLSWALYYGFFETLTAQGIRFISWPVMIMATVVMLYGGGPVARKALSGLRHGVPGMETLIVLGAGSAYLYSLVNWWSGSLHLYFDTAAMLVTLLLLGKLLETQAKNRVRRDLEGFMSLQPTKVRLCSPEFPRGRYAAIEQLTPGDVFRIGAEEVMPADGRVVQGGGRLDMSAVTGEPNPVPVAEGDAVVSGSRVVRGDLTVQAEQVGAASLLGQMIAVVQQTLARKTHLESRTDRLLAIFVPLIAGLAVSTGAAGWAAGLSLDQALVRAVTVLVIACPCALGIAIPLARVAGVAGAGRQGILVRDFEAFEQSTRIDTVVFDKTGTLTHGTWSVERIDLCGGRTEADILPLAMGLESHADHTVARAVFAYGAARGATPAEVEDVRVHADGVSGRHHGRTIRIGRRAFALAGRDVAGTVSGRQGLSEVFLSVDGEPWAAFCFGDRLRAGMRTMVRRLAARGLTVALISGDNEAPTRAVAADVGIGAAAANLLPRDKAAHIRSLQSQGRRVAMVGDGINDAPALVQADLAVAVHTGSGLARHTAGVTLMRDAAQLIDLLDWAAQVDRKVHQNLCCAVGYNAVGISVAMAGLLHPLVAVCAMLLSSLTVIGNTLLLNVRGGSILR